MTIIKSETAREIWEILESADLPRNDATGFFVAKNGLPYKLVIKIITMGDADIHPTAYPTFPFPVLDDVNERVESLNKPR